MKSLLVSVFLSFLLLASPGEAARRTRNLDKALRDIGCNLYADFIRKYPIDEFKQKNITVFAPDNDSVRRYLKENPDRPVRGGSTTRQSQAAINQAKNKNNVSKGAGGSPPFKGSSPKGSVLSTGSGGTSGAKIKKPKPPGSSKRDLEGRREQNYVGTIGAGGGVKTKVLAEAEQFDNGEIFKISSFFADTTNFEQTLDEARLPYLKKIIQRIQFAKLLFTTAETLTFLAPTPEAFATTGLDPEKSRESDLLHFLFNHMIRNGFVGYTPTFEEGACYQVSTGRKFKARFNGTHTTLNDAVVVEEDMILNTGVIQKIDRVMTYSNSRECPP